MNAAFPSLLKKLGQDTGRNAPSTAQKPAELLAIWAFGVVTKMTIGSHSCQKADDFGTFGGFLSL